LGSNNSFSAIFRCTSALFLQFPNGRLETILL
jgi:hypothetical protein